MKNLLCYTALLAYAAISALQAASPIPALTVPANDLTLEIAINLPHQTKVDPAKHWRLEDLAAPGESIPADLVNARDGAGAVSNERQALVAGLPPRAGASGLRRFQLVEDKSTSSISKSSFRFAEINNKSLGLWEGDRPVFVYNFGVLSKPGVPADRNRSTYLHPIYGLDGETLTDDFPEDHHHHRGLFWAWPHVRLGDTNYDLWDLRGIHQRFERWLDRRAGSAAAILGVENNWSIGDKKVMQERVWLTLYPASARGQVLDVDLTWIPTDQPVTLAGAEGKSYGGLTLRFAPRTGTVITTPLGHPTEDLAMTRLAWADLSAQFAGAPNMSGASIFIAPNHPDYPPTWLTRHYGALCVGWPGVTPATFPPGQPIHGRYRLWLHRGVQGETELTRAYRAYESVQKAGWSD